MYVLYLMGYIRESRRGGAPLRNNNKNVLLLFRASDQS